MKKITLQIKNGKSLLALILMVMFTILWGNSSYAQDFAINFSKSESKVVLGEDNMQKLDLRFIYNGINTFGVETTKGRFNEIMIPGTYSTGSIGAPKLPASKKLIEIPFGADVSIKVINYTKTEYKLADYGIVQPIMPVQPSLRKDQNASDITFEYDEQLYKKDMFVGPELASVEVLGVMRGYRIARVTISPVSYNPVQGIVRVYNDVEVELTYSNVDAQLTSYIKASTGSPYFKVIEDKILNRGVGYPNNPDLTKYPVKYLIVSDRMFETDLQPFIQWKTMKGFEVITAYTDEIGSTFAAIQTWIHGQYNAGTPTDPAPCFILLVGDTPQIPAQNGSSSGKMTDLYYASVDGDYFPEMYYGRFSATNSAQLNAQIAKTLYYEKYEFTDPSYLNSVTLIAGADGTWNPNVGQPTVEYGTENYFNAAHGYTNVYAYLTSPYTGCYDNTRVSVSMINYTAHGGQTSWSDPNFSQSMVNALTNTGKYPLAVGNCCLAADFGYNECFGETFMRAANKGAVAYIGSSPSSYWFEDFYWSVGAFPIQGNNSGYVPSYEETTWGAYDGPFVGDYVTADAMVFVGNLAVTEVDIQGYPQHSSPLYYWQAYNMMGDPSIVIYHTEGAENNVSHMAIVPIGMDYYEVTAEPGSYVGISKDGVLHGSALVDETGVCQVPIDPVLSSGMVDIVVTKPQFIPYMMQVPAAALEGPYVVLDNYTISDPTGNNNGLADYSENISLNVTLKNVGADPSAVITATVTGSDQYVSLTGSAMCNFPAIVPGGTATINSAYAFAIAAFVPDQHKAQFVLQITDGSDTWTSNLYITVNSPELSLSADFLIDDSQSGNNDGILDPGETAIIKTNISNEGSSAVSNVNIGIVSGDPYLVINTATVNIASLAAGATSEYSFSVSASAGAPIGYPVNVDLSATAGPGGQYTADNTLMVVIGLIPEYLMSNQTVTTCVGLFYDSGGPSNQYGNSENAVMTFLPASSDGMIKVNFLSFETELNYDYLHIYNGVNTSAPEVMGSPFHGTTSPGTIIGMNDDGALTFEFTSDGSITKNGWEAEITCFTLSGVPECASNPVPAVGAQNVSLSATLSWTSNDALEFDVYFGISANPPFVETVNAPYYTPALLPNTTYYWKIVPKNNNGSAEDCDIWIFTTSGPEYIMANGTVTATNGTFYDSGGATGQYSNNEDFVMTFTPSVPGQSLQFTFSAFETEANYDYLYVHDGPDTSSPEVSGSPFHGTSNPGTITSTHATGALTFHFDSDVSITKLGWAATFQAMGVLSCNPIALPEEICEGNSAILLANASGGTGSYTCLWSPAETLSDPTIMNPVATPTATTTYTVTIDDGDAVITGDVTLYVNPSPQVDLGADATICANQTITLDATTPGAVSYLWTPGGYTTPTIVVDSTGVGIGSVTYSVVVTGANDCEGEDEISITFDPCTFIDDVMNNLSVAVYPNPATNLLNINISGVAESVVYELLNYHGQKVYSRILENVNGSINDQIELNTFARGIYYLRLSTNDNVNIKKVVIN